MNKVSRTDEPYEGEGYNQSPNALSNDLTTNQDLNGIANSRENRNGDSDRIADTGQANADDIGNARDVEPDLQQQGLTNPPQLDGQEGGTATKVQEDGGVGFPNPAFAIVSRNPSGGGAHGDDGRSVADGRSSHDQGVLQKTKHALVTFGKFVGPGFLVSVAYIDPGNYATDIAAGASYQFKLLFVVLMANLFAIFLQSLSIKLGTVSGLNLAEACRVFLPRWLNYVLYAMAEVAIIATDIAEVIGTAIAINLLIPQVPLVAGCAISILDVMVILFFYRPNGSIKGLRAFEFFVVLLVLGVVICFCIQLSLISGTTVGEVFKGYLPSSAVVEQKGLYQACGILGATVMPHSLYLGSGIVQSRLRDYDAKRGLLPLEPVSASSSTHEGYTGSGDKKFYLPSLAAIRHSLKYSYTELALSLFTFALFVNSAILIVAGASLYGNPDALEADIFGIHTLLSESLAPAAGTIFALALLLSGISAGIVCTIAGQMVSEGALKWKMNPALRRLLTRSISITPSIIIAGAVGRSGLNAALNGSQVALSVVLPFVSAPLIWFTCMNKYMTVQSGNARFLVEGKGAGVEEAGEPGGEAGVPTRKVKMANAWYTAAFAVVIWLVIAAMNVANLVLLGLGNED